MIMRNERIKNLGLIIVTMFLPLWLGLNTNAAEDGKAQNRIHVGVSYENLQPGEEYVHFHLREDEIQSQEITPETLLYMDQGQANAKGKLSFDYFICDDAAGERMLYGRESEKAVDVMWTLKDVSLTVYSNGEITDVTDENPAPWESVKEKIHEVTMKNGVTKIGSSIFEGCSELQSITFEGEAPEFDDNCFEGFTGTVIFNGADSTWSLDLQRNYGGNVQWIDSSVTPEPTETETPNPTEGSKESVTEIFDDVYQDWYTEYVQYVYDHNLMTGIKGTRHFAPNDNITKAQVAQVLYNMEGQPVVKNQNVFQALNDVYQAEWYANAVVWAYNSGIVTGDLNTKQFSPNANVTREQLALMLYRYADYKNYDISAKGDLAGLVNADKVANWSEAGVRWAVGNSFISGIDKGSYKDLAPQGNATRAQMAAILMRFCEEYDN